MKIPSSTYRVQLSPNFSLDELRSIVDYLAALGISTVYAAPMFEARKGSTHGYDVIDPYKINREIGTLEDFRLLNELLKNKGMSWLQDIVPNHMAFDGANPWLRDIFELGPDSKYYRFFDIDWEYRGWGKVMAAFLGNSLEEVLKDRELQLGFDDEGFSWNYYDHNYPASARSYDRILQGVNAGEWEEKFRKFSGNDLQWKDLKTGFYRDAGDDPDLMGRIDTMLKSLNESPEQLREILDLQYFKPVHWKTTEKEINYRRFFTINDLICLRMEDPEVFENYHHYIKELCETGLIKGLRIDHIDGLLDPKEYIEQLRKHFGQDLYLIVEKILEWDENLPEEWPVEGTSGYDFLAQVNHLFTKAGNEKEFNAGYQKFIQKSRLYEDLVFEKKLFILNERMAGELHNLWLLLEELELLPEADREEENWKKTLSNFMAAFPVYRIYPDAFPLNELQQETINRACRKAAEKEPGEEERLEYLRRLYLGEAEKDKDKMFRFLQRSQQFTGPLAAKGVEDTTFYIFNRLIAHNEVGDSPENFGISIKDFHNRMLQRKQNFPHAVNATATHDTKRGEDARMRLHVLSELPAEWFDKVTHWNEITQKLREDPNAPAANDTYFIYQALLASFPFEGPEQEDFLSRTKEYLLKVLREAKVRSNWAEPNEEYEQKVFDFIEALLEDKEFRESFDPFQQKISSYGAVKSLGQNLIKITAPGLPDIYQGTEFWDLSYVDPDNRRPVDYDKRKRYLLDFRSWQEEDLRKELEEMCGNYSSGKIKMYSLFKALAMRRQHEDLFREGDYIPLELSGNASESFIAYARREEDQWAVIIVPVEVCAAFKPGSLLPEQDSLKETFVTLPEEAPTSWQHIFTATEHTSNGKLALDTLFAGFPVALLKNLKR